MTQDLSVFFGRGLAASMMWTYERVAQTLQALAIHYPGSRVDWEPGDEEWGRVVDPEGEVVGLVCARVPLGIVRNDLPQSELPHLVEWLRFKSMHDASYRVSPEILERVFGRQPSRNIDYEELSLNDLWWATVS